MGACWSTPNTSTNNDSNNTTVITNSLHEKETNNSTNSYSSNTILSTSNLGEKAIHIIQSSISMGIDTSQIIESLMEEGLTINDIDIAFDSCEISNYKIYRVFRSSSPWTDVSMVSDHINNNTDTTYTDKSGLLLPSQSSRNCKFTSRCAEWKRIKDLSKNPLIVSSISPYAVEQRQVSNTSVVSALIVTALYEQMFKTKLITSIIYPQTYDLNGECEPIYNPNGKYEVKLFINSCYRKVTIDDYLPISKKGKLICTTSKSTSNGHEYWASLIEKAFLKVMGGYDFPGSTTAEDLYVLIKWIPERIGIDDKIHIQSVFHGLKSGHKNGDCLMTLSSRKVTESKADSLGLVPTHCYAVLRVEEVGNHKFMLLKNSWAQKRWNGRFSVDDDTNWTASLLKALNYDLVKERLCDNGVFWMCLEDIIAHFSAIFVSWNPDLFAYKMSVHGFWSKTVGPQNDSYNLGYNAQFTLDVDAPMDKTQDCFPVWILLSKHMENIKREEQDKNDFVTLHVYDETKVNTCDRRVFYRKGAIHTGTYINSPHYLAKIDVCMDDCKKCRYTVVMSQYEKKHNVAYTITSYSSIPITIKPIDEHKLWTCQKTFIGKWDKYCCGGSPNHDTFPENPQFKIKIKSKSNLRFILEAPMEVSINVQLYLCTNDDDSINYQLPERCIIQKLIIEWVHYANNYFPYEILDLIINYWYIVDDDKQIKKSGKIWKRTSYSKRLLISDSGPYRYGFTMMDALNIEEGTYIAIISTFKPKAMSGFKFNIKSNKSVQVNCMNFIKMDTQSFTLDEYGCPIQNNIVNE
eukprot:12151_1